MEERAYIEKLLEKLYRTDGASDLIITTFKQPQMRVYNELVSVGDEMLSPSETESICKSILSEEQLTRFEKNRELDMSLYIERLCRFRINMYYQRGHMAMAVRVISSEIPGFEELGLPPVIECFANLPRGLVLITGPVGSGKSTTVAAMIDHINRTRHCHIVSIEDPIEFTHENKLATVDQREVGIDTLSFSDALRCVLRQSMDVVVVGEVRDHASAQAVMTLAETGHLTLATLHTRGTVASVNRLIDMFPEQQSQQVRSQLSASLSGVLWQQLLPGREDIGGLVLGCEVLRATSAIRTMIKTGRGEEIYNAIQTGKQYQMVTMEQAVKDLSAKGLISEEYFQSSVQEKVGSFC
ncbi:MAG: PilT/PilU family type 4a pilus ATPase [Planctomycetes bacterium]|nr:PilT/PilU family type 4a pilus ATPase [Planctomycetota bacterium]